MPAPTASNNPRDQTVMDVKDVTRVRPEAKNNDVESGAGTNYWSEQPFWSGAAKEAAQEQQLANPQASQEEEPYIEKLQHAHEDWFEFA